MKELKNFRLAPCCVNCEHARPSYASDSYAPDSMECEKCESYVWDNYVCDEHEFKKESQK